MQTLNCAEPPHLTVAAVIEDNGRFLMVQEEDGGRIVINQPAGHVEPGENPIDAVVRETQEETAWQVEPTAIIGCYYDTAADGISYFRICYAAVGLQFNPQQPLDEGIIAAKWFTLQELLASSYPLRSPFVLQSIEDYIKGRRYPLALISTAPNG